MGQILLSAAALGLIWGIMTLGQYITYRILDIADLTVEGTITFGAAIAATMIYNGMSPYLALVCALLGGMGAGLCTGLLHTRLGIPALLSGILTMIALWSINLRVMGKANVSLLRLPTVFTPIQNLLGVNATVSIIIFGVLLCALVVGVLYWFFGTELGNAIRATGNNVHMVRAQGINNNNMTILGLMFSNGLVALSGALIAQQQGFADIQMGTGSIVIGLASLIIGEVLFGRGHTRHAFAERLAGVVLGAVIYRIIIALVLKMGMNANDLKLFTAITVCVALMLPRFKVFLNVIIHSAGKGEKQDA